MTSFFLVIPQLRGSVYQSCQLESNSFIIYTQNLLEYIQVIKTTTVTEPFRKKYQWVFLFEEYFRFVFRVGAENIKSHTCKFLKS